MSDQPPRPNDLDEIMRRLEREFQQRETGQPETNRVRERASRPALGATQPLHGEATPIPPQQRSGVRVALPTEPTHASSMACIAT